MDLKVGINDFGALLVEIRFHSMLSDTNIHRKLQITPPKIEVFAFDYTVNLVY